MYYKPLVLPLLAQVGLTFVVMFWMYSQRVAEFRQRGVHPEKTPTRRTAREVLKDSAGSADNFMNLFETPVLFYTALLLALVLLVNDFLLLQLAWLYVALRAIHSIIHCTYNGVMHRFYVFAASAVVLMGLWVRLAVVILVK